MKYRKTDGQSPLAVRELAIKEAIYCYSDGAFAAGDRLVELFAWLCGWDGFETAQVFSELRGARLSDFDGDEI